MDNKLLLETAVLAGELLLENGAETWRVEDTIGRMLAMSELETAEVFVTMTGFVATLDDPSVDTTMTVVRRVKSRTTNLAVIHEVNRTSRGFCHGVFTLEQARQRLDDLKAHEWPFRLLPFMAAYALIAAGFTMVADPVPVEIFLSAFVGCLTAICQYVCKRLHVRSFLATLFCAAVISVTANIAVDMLGVADSMDSVVIGAIMPLVPGIAITNATFDTLNGDYLSGVARLLEAFVTAAAIAMGISLGLML